MQQNFEVFKKKILGMRRKKNPPSVCQILENCGSWGDWWMPLKYLVC